MTSGTAEFERFFTGSRRALQAAAPAPVRTPLAEFFRKARALGCSRTTVREVRDGLRHSPGAPKSLPDPAWMLQLDWPGIVPRWQ